MYEWFQVSSFIEKDPSRISQNVCKITNFSIEKRGGILILTNLLNVHPRNMTQNLKQIYTRN